MAIDTISESPKIPAALAPEIFDGLPRESQGRWRGLAVVAALALLAPVVVLIVIAMYPGDTGPRLTHTITRGDLLVTVIEQGILESAENTEIKCKVRGQNTVIWVIDSGAVVEPGDEMVRLDTLFIQEQIDERTKYAHWSRSAAERSKAQVAAAELALSEYEQGRHVSELMGLQKDLVIAESNLQSAQNLLGHAQLMADSGYITQLEIEEKEFAVDQARLALELKRTEFDVLKRFTHAEQLQTLQGNLASVTASHAANAERALADASRRDRALEEIEHCVIKADRAGLVIHPNAAQWETAPIAEGATVHKDQVLLIMPDLSKMQVKVGIHESLVDRVQEGLHAQVTLANKQLAGAVSSVASVTRPAGWWTGNEVRYDTLIALPSNEGLMPGMSAEVEINIARYEEVLTIPVAAVVADDEQHFCWVKTVLGTRRRNIALGDSNGVFTVVKQGLDEGDEVVLNPLALAGASDSDSSDAKP